MSGPTISTSLAVDVVSMTVGAGGLLVAALANKRAKDANRLAQEANDLAAQSVTQAEEANRVAVEGNHIASDANTVAERALAATTDHVQYQWRAELGSKAGTVAVLNDSAHTARDVTVVVDERRDVVATGSADAVPAFGEILLDLDSALQHHLVQARHHSSRTVENGTVAIYGPYQFTLRFTVIATSEAGVTHSDTFKHGFSVRQGQIKAGRKRR